MADVEAGTSIVEAGFRSIHSAVVAGPRSDEVAGIGVVLDVDYLAEGIAGLQEVAVAELLLQLHRAAVVVGSPARGQVIDSPEGVVGTVFRHSLISPGHPVRIIGKREPVSLIARVTQLQHPVIHQFVLHAQVPLLDVGCFEVAVNEKKASKTATEIIVTGIQPSPKTGGQYLRRGEYIRHRVGRHGTAGWKVKWVQPDAVGGERRCETRRLGK